MTRPVALFLAAVLPLAGFFLGASVGVRPAAGAGRGPTPAPVAETPQDPRQRLPRDLFVRGEAWRVEDAAPGDPPRFLGYTDCAARRIVVGPHQNEAALRDTLFHELLHAGACRDAKGYGTYWNSPNARDHVGIDRLANYETELFRENPDLVDYLAGRNQ